MWCWTLWPRRSCKQVSVVLLDTDGSWRLANMIFPTTLHLVSVAVTIAVSIKFNTNLSIQTFIYSSWMRWSYQIIVFCRRVCVYIYIVIQLDWLCCHLCAGMALFLKNVAFHGILLDALFEADNHEWIEVYQLLKRGIAEGVVQPLKTTVFERTQVEKAFRYMAQGKHIGKVVLQVSLINTFSHWFNPNIKTISCIHHKHFKLQ